MRRPFVRLCVGLILAMIATAEFAVSTNLLVFEDNVPVIGMLVVVDAVLLLSGLVADEWAGGDTSVAVVVGRVLGAAYCVLSVCLMALVYFVEEV